MSATASHHACRPTRAAGTRVLWISHYPVFGGPHNIPMRIAPALAKVGIETEILLPDEPGSAAERLSAAGIPVTRIPLHRLRRTRDPSVHARSLGAAARDISRIRAVIRRGGFEIVLLTGLTNPHGAIAARLERVPIVWQIIDSANPPYVRAPAMALVRRWADAVLFTGAAIEQLHVGARPLRQLSMRFVPPVDTDTYRPVSDEQRAAIRAELGVPKDAALVGIVANLNPMKGFEWFVRAASRIYEAAPDTWFLISGASYPQHGGYLESLRREMRHSPVPDERWKLRILHDPRLDRLYPALDVKLITSLPASEGQPTTALEAQACGVPVVAVDVGGIRELVQDGVSGFVVPPHDAERLATATLRLLQDAELRAEMARAARGRAEERFTVSACAGVHAEAFRLVCRQ